MYERVNERVSVVAIFRDTTPIFEPVKFKWKGRERIVQKVGYVYKYKEGQALVHVVSVTDGESFYELLFDSQKLTWTIGRMAVNDSS